MNLIKRLFTTGKARGVDLNTIYYSTASSVTNKSLLDLYHNDVTIRSNLNFIIDEVLNDKIVSNKEVVNRALKEWDLNLSNITKELLIFGYSIQFVNYDTKRLESIRMSNVMGINHDNKGNPVSFKYNGKNVPFDKDHILIQLPSVDVIVDNKNSWLYPLLVNHTIDINGVSYTYNIYELYNVNQFYLMKAFKDNIASKNIIVLEDNADIQELIDSLSEAKTRDSIMMSGIKDIKTLKGSSDSSALTLLEKAQEILTLATNTSFNFLLLKQNFTEASANITKQLIEKRLQSLKSALLECIKDILEKLGYKNFTLRFIDEAIFTLDQVVRLKAMDIIDKNEARRLLGIDDEQE